MDPKANTNDSVQQIKQAEQNRIRQKQAQRKAPAEIDKRLDGPNRPSI